MIKNKIISTVTKAEKIVVSPPASQWRWLFSVATLALFILALWMRLHNLGQPFDRDSYDEGVYWQSLRSMSAGHPLYKEVFYSQPPFFLLSVFPAYLLGGQTIWSARLGIALVSLLGLLGAFLLGKALAGRVGALAALCLLVFDPLYLAQSQSMQAEAPSVAFSILAVGLSYLWWENPTGVTGSLLAALTAATLMLGILCKLLALAALVPIVLLAGMHLWRSYQKSASGQMFKSILPLLMMIIAGIVILALNILPFIDALHQFWRGVVTFHTDASRLFKSIAHPSNLSILQVSLMSLIGGAALYGTVVALLKKDWRVLPLLGWLAATLYLLWQQSPLFHHHLVFLFPPLQALVLFSLKPIDWSTKRIPLLSASLVALGLIALLTVAWFDYQQVRHYYATQRIQSNSDATNQQLQVAADLHMFTTSDHLVVTDAQFLAGLAERSTPPDLVDTSMVRINTGYLTGEQLIQEASQPQVQAVLFYSGRFSNSKTAIFHRWVTQHLHLVRNYKDGRELWIKI